MAFEHLNASRVFIRCAAANERSAAVARRAGFLYEGRLRNEIRDSNGDLHDSLIFSMVPDEWTAECRRARNRSSQNS
jgi:RimJ/RimL family protein N-acetyltransferase